MQYLVSILSFGDTTTVEVKYNNYYVIDRAKKFECKRLPIWTLIKCVWKLKRIVRNNKNKSKR